MKNIVKIAVFMIAATCMFGSMKVEAQEKSINQIKGIKITFSEGTQYFYSGKEIMPEVESVSYTDENGNVQTITDGFEIIYTENSNNIVFGKASVYITIAGYKGEKKVDDAFSIGLGNVTALKAALVDCTSIKLTWDETPGAHGYMIYRSTQSGTRGSLLKKLTDSDAVYYDQSVTLGETYYYTVRAYRKISGKQTYGEYSSQLKQKAKPAKVEGVTAKRQTYNSIKISWNTLEGACGYRVYRSDSENGTYKSIATIKNGTTAQYINKSVTCGKTYYYKVAAYYSCDGNKLFGNKSVAAARKTTPAKIEFNSNTISKIDSVVLCWNRSSGAEGYEIYRSTKETSGYSLVKTITKADTLQWTNTKRDINTVYYYKIRPYTTVDEKKVYGSYSAVYKKEILFDKISEIEAYTYVNYVSGGNTPSGWDCSGFTQWIMKNFFGINLPRSSAEQASYGTAVDKDDMSKWLPGDILVYSAGGRVNHVALYLGNGKLMHALNSKYGTIIQDVEYYENWDSKNNLSGVRRCF